MQRIVSVVVLNVTLLDYYYGCVNVTVDVGVVLMILYVNV